MKLISLFKKLKKDVLVKTSFFNGIANIVKILVGLISNKVVSVILGPAGIAILGQFSNFFSIISTLSTGGITTGVTKLVSENRDDDSKISGFIRSSFTIIILSASILILIVIVFANNITLYVFKDYQYEDVIVLSAISLIFYGANFLFSAILNGYKEFKKLIILNIVTSILGLISTIIFVLLWNLKGALFSVIISQTFVTAIIFFYIFRAKWFTLQNFKLLYDRKIYKELLKFALMAITSAFAVSFIQLQVRSYIISNLSINEAGYWQGVMKISDMYLMVITTTLSLYYLPRYSEIKSDKELRREIFKGYKFLLPIVLSSSILIFVLKNIIIRLLFSSDFIQMSDLFLFQLIGNIFKVSAWLIAYIMIAKTMYKVYIISEIVFGLLYYALSVLFIDKFGVIGATYSFCANYILYFIFIVFYFRNLLFTRDKLKIA